MPLSFSIPTTLPGSVVTSVSISLVEIRPPDSITYWYDRTTDRGVAQAHLTLGLAALKAKYPLDYAAVFTILQKVGYAEAAANSLVPPGGVIS